MTSDLVSWPSNGVPVVLISHFLGGLHRQNVATYRMWMH
jgi:hypothetical protein